MTTYIAKDHTRSAVQCTGTTIVSTPSGNVTANTGDYVLTDESGNEWVFEQAAFEAKFIALS